MTILKNPVTGHQVKTDEKSVEFWTAAGYQAEQKAAPEKKAGTSKKSSNK